MEKVGNWEQETLINELNQGRELTEQLKNQLDTLASPEYCEFLIQKIISSYENALSALNLGSLVGELHQADGMLGTPQSLAGSSPRSEVSDRDFKGQCPTDVYKKRKRLPSWSHQIRVCLGTGVDDGYSWRKYGQKAILGANFPRAYYRCTHRNVQGCLATKLVQKSDEDPSIFEITYRGRHTCIQTSRITSGLASVRKEGPKLNNDQPHQEEENQTQSHEILFDFGIGLKTEGLGIMEEAFPSFSFPSTPIASENVETNIFPVSMEEKNFLGSDDSPAFLSQERSESNFFSLLPCQMDDVGFSHNLLHSESDPTEIISAPNSVSNSPDADLDFDPSFTFDASEYFA